MIPKIIHYCWFGGNKLPKLAKKCIKSWKKYCPDYEIIRWDENNYDISAAPLYVRQAYEAKKWAFVTDYVRLQVVYEQGGVYLDTDVELIKPLDGLLGHKAYFGFEDGKHVATGLGFGAERGTPILREMMDDYADIPFVLADGNFDLTACPVRNTQVLLRHGLKQDDSEQCINGNIRILPSAVLCPIMEWENINRMTDDTISIHWFSASWVSKEELKSRSQRQKRRRKQEQKEFWRYLPNRAALKLLGEKRYEALKNRMKGK